MKTSLSKFYGYLVFGLLVVIAWQPLRVHSEEKTAPYHKQCSEFKSGKDFVRSSSLYCLGQPKTRACQKEARRHFDSCKFGGDYKSISREVHSDLLLLFVFSKAPRLGQILDAQS